MVWAVLMVGYFARTTVKNTIITDICKNAGSPAPDQHWTQFFQAESNAKAISVLESMGNLKSEPRAGN